MKIFLLQRIKMAGVDETQAMIIIALNEIEARRTATACRHNFNADGEGYGDEGVATWRNDKLTPCTNLGNALPEISAGIVLTSYHHA
jgi:hypothetical protein